VVAEVTVRGRREAKRSAGRWLLVAWFFGLVVATPLYTPYPRLMLPLHLAACLALGAGLGDLVDFSRDRERTRAAIAKCGAWTLVLVVLVSFASTLPSAWVVRTGSARLAGAIARDVAQPGSTTEPVVLVYGDPATFHHLRVAGVAAAPVGEFDFTTQPLRPATFLFVGPYASHGREFAAEWERVRDHFELVAEYEYEPSSLVRANLRAPNAPEAPRRETLRLYRWREAR
jgi:dolichyl-phosphate-mannose-protein mannosyltransferase